MNNSAPLFSEVRDDASGDTCVRTSDPEISALFFDYESASAPEVL